jgi:hypothetical protein
LSQRHKLIFFTDKAQESETNFFSDSIPTKWEMGQ